MSLNKGMTTIAIGLVTFYQKALSPIKPKRIRCRFHPTCSTYAKRALRKYGFRKALPKIINRLSRCNPHNRESCIDHP